MSALLDVRGLGVEFQTRKGVARVLESVSFSLARGQTLGIVGESGCGKSMTALAIMRLIPDPPGRITSGQVLFEEQDLLALPEARMRDVRGNRVSMIFQEPMTSLNPVYTVGEQIAEARAPAPGAGPARGARARDRDARSGRHPGRRRRASTSIRTSSRAACASA